MTIKFEWPPKNIISYTRKKHKFKQYGKKIKKKKKKKKKKLRLSVCCFTQKEGIGFQDTFSPVLKNKSLKIITSIAEQN